MKRLLYMLCGVALLTAGCAKAQAQQEYKTLDDIMGKRVGVIMGRGPDWALETMPEIRDTMDVARYNEMSDILLALKFHKVDALLMDEPQAQVFMRLQGKDYNLHKGVLPPMPMSFLFSQKPEALEWMTEFNAFIKDFRETEEYADIMRRTFDLEEEDFVGKKVENIVTTDRVIRAVFSDSTEPISYVDPETGELCGMSLEIMTHFANSVGARLEVKHAFFTTCIMETNSGKADVFAYSYALARKEACEMRGAVTLSDEVMQQGLAIINKKVEE